MKYFSLIVFLLSISALTVCAQEKAKETSEEKEPAAVVEIGGASSFNVKGGSAFGYNVSVETTLVKEWLELELGVAPVFDGHNHETDIDLVFKKPWTLSSHVEFMLGVGPAYTHEKSDDEIANRWSGEVAADFMFWPGEKHRLGLFIVPAY